MIHEYFNHNKKASKNIFEKHKIFINMKTRKKSKNII